MFLLLLTVFYLGGCVCMAAVTTIAAKDPDLAEMPVTATEALITTLIWPMSVYFAFTDEKK